MAGPREITSHTSNSYWHKLASELKRLEEREVIMRSRQLRLLRLGKGLSQRDVAYRAGRTVTQISRLENGKCEPTARTVEALARALEIDLTEFRKLLGL